MTVDSGNFDNDDDFSDCDVNDDIRSDYDEHNNIYIVGNNCYGDEQ